jgi:hypothetical protein
MGGGGGGAATAAGGRSEITPRDDRSVIAEAIAVERMYLARVTRIEQARKAASRDQATKRLEQIDQTLERLDTWRDGRIEALRETLGSSVARADLDRALERIQAGEEPDLPSNDGVDPEPAAQTAPEAAAATGAAAGKSMPPARRTADPRTILRRNPLDDSPRHIIIGAPRKSAPDGAVAPPESGADEERQVSPAIRMGEPPKRDGPATVERTEKGSISINLHNRTQRMKTAAAHQKR